MNGLLLTADLLIASQMPAGQGVLKVVSKPAQAVEECNRSPIHLIAIDLTLAGLDIAGLVVQLRVLDAPPSSIIAFGPHVQTARLQAAREAGCDEVISRGELHVRLPKLLA